MFNITCHTDNCYPIRSIGRCPLHSLAYRVLPFEALYQTFVDNADQRCIFVVELCEIAAGEERNLHDSEVISFHAARLDPRLFTYGNLLSFDNEAMRQPVAAHR